MEDLADRGGADSARATSVFPTPASPSNRRGFSMEIAR